MPTLPALVRRDRVDPVPLTFSQLYHYKVTYLSQRPGTRSVASAVRLYGRLNRELLAASLLTVVARHESLRVRIRALDGALAQELCESRDYGLKFDDLTRYLSSSRELELARLMKQYVLRPVDIELDPLFEVRLFRLRDDEHVLLVAMEHLISDAWSRSILVRDLLTAYFDALNGRPLSLPPVAIHFMDYACWQHDLFTTWSEQHGAYWDRHLLGCPRTPIPGDIDESDLPTSDWSSIPFQLGSSLKSELLSWCRSRHTTAAMAVFTVYAALLLRWSAVPEMVLQYQINGRDDPGLESAIGYFAAVLYLRVQLDDDDNFMDLLRRVISLRGYHKLMRGTLRGSEKLPSGVAK